MLRVLPARCLTWKMYVVSYQKNWLPPVSIYLARPVQVWQWLSRPVRGKDEETPCVAGGSSTAAWRAWSWACLLPVSGKGSAPGEPRVRTLGEGFSLLGPEGSAGSPYMPGNGEGSLVLSIVGVRLGLGYAKALHARLGAWSPHQQPPGMLQRRLPAGPLSAFSTLQWRRIGIAFSALALFDKSGHLFEVPNPKRVQACPCSAQACNPSRRQNMTS
ncbi:uncharacterized protein LOC144162895 isoform X2 [Haemaphysalis longicornis]